MSEHKQALMKVMSDSGGDLQQKWLSGEVARFLAKTYPEEFVVNGQIVESRMNQYVGLGASMGVHPLSGNIYPVNFKGKVTPVIKYTYLATRMRMDSNYVYHKFVDVYEHSTVIERDGTIEVSCEKSDPGNLIGFVLYIHLKGCDKPHYKRVLYREWEKIKQSKLKTSKGETNYHSPWNNFWELMIKKTVLAHFVRLVMGNTLPAGVLTEDERDIVEAEYEDVQEAELPPSTPQELPPAPEPKEEKPRKAPPIRHRKPKATPAPEPAPPAKENEPEPPAEKKPTGPAPTLFDDPLLDLRNQARQILKEKFNGDREKANAYLSKNNFPPVNHCNQDELEVIIDTCGGGE